MKRILLMVLYNLPFVPYWWCQLCWYARYADKISEEKRYALIKKITLHANKGGRVKIAVYGKENIPEDGGFIFFPNHQGLFDVLAIIEACDRFFAPVAKIEVEKIPFLNQVFRILKAKFMDRSDVRQNMRIIKEISEEVKEGSRYLIFPEGTRSKEGNHLLAFKGGSFKSAVYARCPIVPVAMIDSFKPFDTNTISPVTVQVHFLAPVPYEVYGKMKTTDIAQMVREKIEAEISRAMEEE